MRMSKSIWRHTAQHMQSFAEAVKVGILGTGWGVKVQVPQFRVAGLNVTAIYSRDPQRAADLAVQHKLTGFSDANDLINSPDGIGSKPLCKHAPPHTFLQWIWCLL